MGPLARHVNLSSGAFFFCPPFFCLSSSILQSILSLYRPEEARKTEDRKKVPRGGLSLSERRLRGCGRVVLAQVCRVDMVHLGFGRLTIGDPLRQQRADQHADDTGQ
jgi:hypothetical protein